MYGLDEMGGINFAALTVDDTADAVTPLAAAAGRQSGRDHNNWQSTLPERE